MMGLLSNFVFLNPLILCGLAALPVLFFLLRITPPSPKLIKLPSARFLQGLIPQKQTSSHTPWWILLLRLIIAALVILALAHPVYNPGQGLTGGGPVRIVLDNGWPAAPTWDTQIRAALDITAQAARENREVYILTTANMQTQDKPFVAGPLSGGRAEAIIKGLAPLPWPADYKSTVTLVEDKSMNSWWLGHGLDEGNVELLAESLLKNGNVSYLAPPPEQLPLLLKRDEEAPGPFSLQIVAAENTIAGRPAYVQALSSDGAILDQKTVMLDPAALPAKIKFEIPEAARGDITSFHIGGRQGAGGTLLLDESAHKRLVGLVGPSDEKDMKPFIEARYYLTRALEPYADIMQDDIGNILKASPSIIILPDIAAMPADDLNALEKWVKDGGLLLRFAGPTMAQAQGEAFLVPVPLRLGGRSMDGSLTWEAPAKLQAFPDTSPFYGIALHEEIPIRQQILAQPTDDLDKKTWARLEDGTPLITAAAEGKGLLVMVHTTASPDWSDLPLSGVFVEILQRIVSLSGNTQSAFEKTDGFLQPTWLLDGYGALQKPPANAESISAAKFADTVPSSHHPPGLYGREGFQRALNIGPHIKKLTPAVMPSGVQQRIYGTDYEQDMMPRILYAALMLLIADWLIMSVLMSGFRALSRIAIVVLLIGTTSAYAQGVNDIKYADGFYLAYIKSGDMTLDNASETGLANLARVLMARTSVEPAGVAGLNPETDNLVFFPLIYWPMSSSQIPLSDEAIKNVQHYLDHGGTILFDTRDRNYAASLLTGTVNANMLRTLTAPLNIPPLEPLSREHVLNRSFYLLNPGRSTGYDPGTIWAEANVSGRDGVSSVFIGSHDWAGAWAAGNEGTRRQELEFRFGVNLVMYALTGNYKADQVHIPHILQRLGE